MLRSWLIFWRSKRFASSALRSMRTGDSQGQRLLKNVEVAAARNRTIRTAKKEAEFLMKTAGWELNSVCNSKLEKNLTKLNIEKTSYDAPETRHTARSTVSRGAENLTKPDLAPCACMGETGHLEHTFVSPSVSPLKGKVI